jgi:hypothetical protein
MAWIFAPKRNSPHPYPQAPTAPSSAGFARRIEITELKPMPMSSPDLLLPEDNGNSALPPLMPPHPGELQCHLACINASARGMMSNSSDIPQFTHGTLAQRMDNQCHGHHTQICVEDPCPHSSARSTCQGSDCPWANQTATTRLNYFQALGSNDELDRMPRRIHGTPTLTAHINQPDVAYSQWETFTMAVCATPLDKNDNLTARGIRGLLREQARTADAALADFRPEVRNLAWANKVQSNKNHWTVATLQPQLKQVLGSWPTLLPPFNNTTPVLRPLTTPLAPLPSLRRSNGSKCW